MTERNRAAISVLAMHGMVLAIVIRSQLIGIIGIPIGISTVIALPILYAFALGLVFNPNILKASGRFLDRSSVKLAATMITIASMPFIARFGTTVGPQMAKILEVGPALISQEIGNLSTILIAFPVAGFLLRMGREAIGATYSIDREPNLALIAR